MEVHHHTHSAEPDIHRGRKKWTHYFWEFLMLFLAVFCGFLAEYQLEHKIEKDREKQYIKSLITDLGEDTISLSASVSNLNTNINRLDTLIHLLCSKDIKNRGADLYYLGRWASRRNPVTINDRTIQQMKNAGGFRLIQKEKATKAIIDYYNRLSFINHIQVIESSETEEYRKRATYLFHPEIFDSLVLPDNNIIRPSGNPGLMIYDTPTLFAIANMISYMKNGRLALAKSAKEMKETAKELILHLKKEYHLK